jgi:hypothetical protein
MASYPGSVKVFSARSAGQVIDASHMNDVQDEINAIESGLLNGTAPVVSSNITATRLVSSSNLQVNGASTITSNLAVGGNVVVTGAHAVGGESSVASNMFIGGQLALSGALVFGGIQTSTFSGGNVNDLALGASVVYLRVDPSSNSTLTGLQGAGGSRRMLIIQNVGGAALHLPHNNAGSVSTNRWFVRGSVGSTVESGAGVVVVYDATGWRTVQL